MEVHKYVRADVQRGYYSMLSAYCIPQIDAQWTHGKQILRQITTMGRLQQGGTLLRCKDSNLGYLIQSQASYR